MSPVTFSDVNFSWRVNSSEWQSDSGHLSCWGRTNTMGFCGISYPHKNISFYINKAQHTLEGTQWETHDVNQTCLKQVLDLKECTSTTSVTQFILCYITEGRRFSIGIVDKNNIWSGLDGGGRGGGKEEKEGEGERMRKLIFYKRLSKNWHICRASSHLSLKYLFRNKWF